MDNKKILVSLLLVLIVALSLSAVSAGDSSAGNTYKPEANTSDAVQTVINGAGAGDTIDLSAFDAYDFGNATVEVGVSDITIKGNGATTIEGWGGPGNGIFHVSASKVTIQGIKFVDTNPNSVMTYYNDATKNAHEVKGWGIHLQKATFCVIDNCSFINFNHGVRIQQQANDNTVSNCYFTGVTNYLRNDPTVNVEKGTKAIGIMGSQRATLVNNTFEGPVLDAISIASGSAGCSIVGNTFIGNSYAIYFGGASTGATKINNNTFRKVGHYEGLDNNNATVIWDALPMISIQKAASGLEICYNNFEAIENNILIAAEAGNAAHGYPSEIGNIDIIGNDVTKYTSDVSAASVTLLHVLSRGAELNPTGPITVTGNNFTGPMKSIVFWINSWGNETGAAVIPKGALVSTTLSIANITSGSVVVILKDINGKAISGETVSYTINGGNVENATTGEDGAIAIVGAPNDAIAINFDETKVYAASEAAITLPNYANPIDTVIAVNNVTVKAQPGKTTNVTAILTANGAVLANKTVTITLASGEGADPIIGTTDENGTFTAPVSIAAAGSNAILAYFEGDDIYASALALATYKVTKNTVTLTNPTKTYKVKATKKITLTLKSAGKAVAGKKVTLKVNGKTYTATTKSNGQAIFTVKITKTGTYSYTAKFAGDGAYNSISKTGKIVVKK